MGTTQIHYDTCQDSGADYQLASNHVPSQQPIDPPLGTRLRRSRIRYMLVLSCVSAAFHPSFWHRQQSRRKTFSDQVCSAWWIVEGLRIQIVSISPFGCSVDHHGWNKFEGRTSYWRMRAWLKTFATSIVLGIYPHGLQSYGSHVRRLVSQLRIAPMSSGLALGRHLQIWERSVRGELVVMSQLHWSQDRLYHRFKRFKHSICLCRRQKPHRSIFHQRGSWLSRHSGLL